MDLVARYASLGQYQALRTANAQRHYKGATANVQRHYKELEERYPCRVTPDRFLHTGGIAPYARSVPVSA
eukprot:3030329-Rhodomonas_salina.2